MPIGPFLRGPRKGLHSTVSRDFRLRKRAERPGGAGGLPVAGAPRVLVHLNHRHTNGQREEGAIMTHARVRDVMTTDVITVAGTTDYREVAARLRESRVSAFPVLDDDGRVAGVVSA